MKQIRSLIPCFVCLLIHSYGIAQQKQPGSFSSQDTLRGSLTAERSWWDVRFYGITVKPDFASKTIQGSVRMKFTILQDGKNMQIDLQHPMEVSAVNWNNKTVPLERNGN